MEDAHVVCRIPYHPHIFMSAIFDGHGGTKVLLLVIRSKCWPLGIINVGRSVQPKWIADYVFEYLPVFCF